jgi:hypothetical protein
MPQNRLDYGQDASGLYRRLLGSDIRLLKLHAGDDAIEIECDLEQLPLGTRPDYYALSYVWGDDSKRRSILINGQRRDITENLYDALRHLRRFYVRQNFSPSIWVDALCINQNDTDERSQQVTRMTNIYTISRQVIIWLGISDEEIDQSIGKLFRMAFTEALARSSNGEALRDFPSGSREEAQDADSVLCDDDQDDPDDPDDPDDHDDNGLDNLLALTTILGMRPWFSRIWTVQEACLGARDPILWAGHHHVAMQDLVDLLLDLAQCHPRYVVACYNVLALARIRHLLCHTDHPQVGSRTELRDTSTSMAQFFVDLLCIMNRRKATSPLDQLYGLLGLVGVARNEELPERLRPDYTSTTELVYLRYATWVTDFRYLQGTENHLTSCRSSVSTDGHILSVQGFTIGTCDNQIQPCKRADLLDVETRKLVSSSCLARFRLFEKEILGRSANLKQRSVEDTLESWLSFIDEEISRTAYQDFRDRLDIQRLASRVQWLAVNELSLVNAVASGWFVLADGTIVKAGMVDARIDEGDLVCLFKGSPLPSIVRKAYHRYQFVCSGDITDGPYGSGVKFDESFGLEDVYVALTSFEYLVTQYNLVMCISSSEAMLCQSKL